MSKYDKLLKETLKPFVQYEKNNYDGSKSISVSNEVYDRMKAIKDEAEKEFGGIITMKDFATSFILVLLKEYEGEE